MSVTSYNGPSSPPINFRPYANPTAANVTQNTTTAIGLAGVSGNPTQKGTESFSYSLLSQPQHGSITDFNAATGAFFYTPEAGKLVGTDTFQYQVQSTNSAMGPVTTSNAGTDHDHGRAQLDHDDADLPSRSRPRPGPGRDPGRGRADPERHSRS